MRHLPLAACVLIGLCAVGCAKARAEVEPPMPDLLPPASPPRVVAIYEAEVTAPALPPPPAPSEEEMPVPDPPRPARPRTTAEPEVVNKPASPPAAAPQTPALTLRSAGGNEGATGAAILHLLARARGHLARVVYAGLDPDGRTQFDTAKRFLEQADEALKSGNVLFAGKLADKAATMAAVLVR